MRYLSYLRDGALRHGRLEGEVADPEAVVRELGDGDLQAVIERAGTASAGDEPGGPTLRRAEIELRAPLVRPGKLLGVAANYQEHVREAGAADLQKSRISPRLFLKPPTAISYDGGRVAIPALTHQMDYEAELSAVIGRRCRDVAVPDALGMVFGYMTSNDISARNLDLGYEREQEDQHVNFFDWLEGKWPDGFAPLGPLLVTADETPDPQDLRITLDVDGERRQDSSTAAMIFTVAELISFASHLMTLEPGDVIMTGTPSGVGAATGTYLRPGQRMTATLERLGSLTTEVIA